MSSLQAYVDANAAMANRKPTDAQKEAGTYRKGHVRIHGLNFAIENAKDSYRSGKGADGKSWRCKLPAHYGYIKGTEGADGDHVDCYIGPHVKSPKIWVVDQRDADSGDFDEHKAFIGFANKAQVDRCYGKAFSDGRASDRMGKVHEMSVEQFKTWLKDGDQTKPLKRASGGRVEELPDAPWGSGGDLPDAPWDAKPKPQGFLEKVADRFNSPPNEPSLIGMAGKIWKGVTAPGDVYSGKLDPRSQEATERAADLASVVTLGGVPRVASPNAIPKAAPQSTPNSIAAAADRISEVSPTKVEVPRAFASDSMAVQRAGQLARNVPIVGDSIPRATGRMVDQLGEAKTAIAKEFGEGSGPNVANRVGQTLEDTASAETRAATAAAQRSDEALTNAWQEANDAALTGIAAHEANSLAQARASVGDMSPQDMGQALITRLRAGEQEALATKNRLYQTAGESDAAVTADAVGQVRSRVVQTLDDAGRVIDRELTPASSRMLDELERFSNLNIENRAVGARLPLPAGETVSRPAVSVQGIEQTRKRLNSMAQSATNDADRAAARRIIREFDNWESDAFDNALFSGSPEALATYRQARDANRNWRHRFHNDDDDAARIINRIVTGEVTPQEVSNWLVGASQVGSKGLSSRLLTRIAEATGNDADAMAAIRGGVWNRLTTATEGVTAKTPAKTADGIGEFLNGSGRDIANRLFTPEQRGFMDSYARTLRRGIEAREALAGAARNTRPVPMEVGPGPMQQLANAVLGKGGKADEALFSAINSYAKSGSRGDIKALSDILRVIPQKDRGDLAGAVISSMGRSKTTGEFSPDVFASEWLTYTPQAKTILFGNAGPHRQALDDIAKISQRYKDVGRRFGNPSGTSQNVAGLGIITALMAEPITALTSLIGGTIAARVLSSPVAAHKAATWAKTSRELSKGSTPARVAAFETASRNLAAAASNLGANVAASDFMRLLQGPVPARGTDENQEAVRIRNNQPNGG